MTSKLLLSIGKIGSVSLAALVVAALFSTAETATAQMMMQQHRGMSHSMFDVMGMSMVQDVKISGVSITGNNTVSVNLTYTGNGTSPGVTIVAMTNHMTMMMNMMMGGGMMGGMMRGPEMMNMPGMMMNNSEFPGMMRGPEMMNMPGMMMNMAGSQTGSATVNSGWESGSSTTVMLEGDGSVHDASDICVIVFPHLT